MKYPKIVYTLAALATLIGLSAAASYLGVDIAQVFDLLGKLGE